MKILAVFAHPDDEAFGPGGTLAKLAKSNQVYLVCVTNGDSIAGNKKADIKLGEIRKIELETSSRILGIRKVHFLNYHDGSLNHNLYHEIADNITKISQKIRPLTMITFARNGISGHLDHIAVSLIASFIFHKLPFIRTLMNYCISQQHRKLIGDYFIFFPPGVNKEDINRKIDISLVWDTKIKAMLAHKSQRHDCERVLKILSKLPKEENFIIEEKGNEIKSLHNKEV